MTRERVVPIISASISCDTLTIIFEAGPACQNERASNKRARARRFSLPARSTCSVAIRAGAESAKESIRSCAETGNKDRNVTSVSVATFPREHFQGQGWLFDSLEAAS